MEQNWDSNQDRPEHSPENTEEQTQLKVVPSSESAVTPTDSETQNNVAPPKKTSRRGFASMDPERRREIARRGGAAVARNRDHMASIGRRGGAMVSQDRSHMASIGRKGGEIVSQDRTHMSAIGRRGGESVSQDRQHMSDIGRRGGEARIPEGTSAENLPMDQDTTDTTIKQAS